MSGSASSGMRRIAQIPAITSTKVAVNTRKRLRAHQSIHRAITLHTSRGGHRELFTPDGLAVLPRQDGDLPRSAALEPARTFVGAASLFRQIDLRAHARHAHGGHGGHD